MTVARRLVVYTRDHCPLCDDFLLELHSFLATRAPAEDALACVVLDVDVDPLARRRFGLKVPVLLLDGEPLFHGHFDAAGLARMLAH